MQAYWFASSMTGGGKSSMANPNSKFTRGTLAAGIETYGKAI